MNYSKLSATAALGACVLASVSFAQTALVQWSFADVAAGTKTNIAASSFNSSITVSLLTDRGATNNVGVRGATPFGTVQASGSATYSGPAYEVGMATTPNTSTPASTDYALAFTVAPNVGTSVTLTSLSFDLGYDTDFATSSANYFAPYLQLYVSTDGVAWSAVGAPQTLTIANTAIFSTGAGSGGVHYVQTGFSLGLESSSVAASMLAGQTAHFRLALGDGGSASDRRRVLVDNITVNGTASAIPEPSTYAFVLGLAALVGVGARRRRRA